MQSCIFGRSICDIQPTRLASLSTQHAHRRYLAENDVYLPAVAGVPPHKSRQYNLRNVPYRGHAILQHQKQHCMDTYAKADERGDVWSLPVDYPSRKHDDRDLFSHLQPELAGRVLHVQARIPHDHDAGDCTSLWQRVRTTLQCP